LYFIKDSGDKETTYIVEEFIKGGRYHIATEEDGIIVAVCMDCIGNERGKYEREPWER
jgi:hypothetical protein